MVALPFNLPFEAAIRFFRRRIVVPAEDYARLDAWTKRHAFSVAYVAKARLLQDIRNELTHGLENGTTVVQFNAAQPELMKRNGWAGTKPFHVETIFRTNGQMAYGVGHREQQLAVREFFPFLLFDALNDSRTREAHRKLDDTVLPQTDLFWRRYYPPCGYNCRCHAHELSAEEAQAMGISRANVIDDDAELEFAGPGVGDDYMPDLRGLDPDLQAYVRAAMLKFDAATTPQ